jgi:hypothetical protein
VLLGFFSAWEAGYADAVDGRPRKFFLCSTEADQAYVDGYLTGYAAGRRAKTWIESPPFKTSISH